MFGFNDLSTPLKAIIALAFVLVLVVVAGLLLRRIAGGRLSLPGQGGRARQPRLGVVDIFELDRQRQLVLLRRDNVEHLVMIGGPNDVVVEASIVRGQTRAATQPPQVAAASAAAAPETELPPPALAPPLSTAISPALSPAQSPAAKIDAPVSAERAEPRLAPAAAVAGLAAAGVAATAAIAARAGQPSTPMQELERLPAEPRQPEPLPPAAVTPEPVRAAGPMEAPALDDALPAAPEPRRLPDFLRPMAQREAVPVAAAPPEAPSSPTTTHEPADAVEAVADPADLPIDVADLLAAELANFTPETYPTPEPPAVPEPSLEPLPAPSPLTAPGPVAPPAAVRALAQPDAAADLARELEKMLGAPASPILEPAVLAPAASPADDSKPSPGPAIDFEAELAQALDGPIASEPAEPADEAAPETPAVADAAAADREPDSDALAAEDEPEADEAKSVEEKPADATPTPKADDPFSVDAIEAEFARLLNRPISR